MFFKKGFGVGCGGFLLNVFNNNTSWRSLHTESCVHEEVLRLGKGCFLWCVFLLLALSWCPLQSITEHKCLILGEQRICGDCMEKRFCFQSSDYPRIWALPGWHILYTSGLIRKKPKKGEGICHRPSWKKHRDFCHRRIQEDIYWFCEIVLGHHRFGATAWNSSIAEHTGYPGTWSLSNWAGFVAYISCEMKWTLQTLPFRTIIAFLRTIMYYVRCIIYSGGYWFIKEPWANCQVIVWTVVMSNNKGYNLHSYSVFKLMRYPAWNPALGFLFLCFLIFMNLA